MNCSICFDDITKATGSTTLSCEHVFHFRCIDKWLTKQIIDDIEQTCPCCRGKGGEFDRLSVISAGEEEDEDDETYVDDEAEGEEDADSILNEIPEDARDLLWERVGEGRWLITSRQDLAYEGLRSLFGKENDLDADPAPVPAVVSKIQALFRGHVTRQAFHAARALTALMN
jgi:hypothetical protein